MTMAGHKEITTRPAAGRVVVRWQGAVVADSRRAVALLEEGYPPVFYLPKADVRVDLLTRSERQSRCPHKGDARYWSLVDGEAVSPDAAWAYEAPFEKVSAIAGRIAFYPDRVDGIEVMET
jgi:uncharacterized protein (DUF427 family)